MSLEPEKANANRKAATRPIIGLIRFASKHVLVHFYDSSNHAKPFSTLVLETAFTNLCCFQNTVCSTFVIFFISFLCHFFCWSHLFLPEKFRRRLTKLVCAQIHVSERTWQCQADTLSAFYFAFIWFAIIPHSLIIYFSIHLGWDSNVSKQPICY